MKLIPTVFLGTPEFASYHLRALLNGTFFKVVGVVSQPDKRRGRGGSLEPSEVKKLALERGLEVITSRVHSKEFLHQVKLWQAEVVIVVAFGEILSQEFLDLFPKKVVNIHASLLPRWRGAAPIQRALMAGDLLSGVVLQVMVQELDAGDIVGKRELALGQDMDVIELCGHLKVLGVDLLKNELVQYLKGEIQPQPQDPEKVTYAKKIDKKEFRIDWNLEARNIYNHLRGIPGMYTFFRSKKLKIHRTQVVDVEKKACEPGKVSVDRKREALVVSCGKGTWLSIFEVQLESRARVPVMDFLRGEDLHEGEVFL